MHVQLYQITSRILSSDYAKEDNLGERISICRNFGISVFKSDHQNHITNTK